MPAFVDLEAMERDVALFGQLLRVLMPLEQLLALMESTAMASGSVAYSAALSYYNSVKQAAKAGIPGAQVVYERLRGRFAQSGATVPVGGGAAPAKADAPTAKTVV